MSASMNWMPWCSDSVLPNVSRSVAYRAAWSSAAWAMPSAWAAIPGRERSSTRIAVRNPVPSSPTSASAGTRQPSNTSSPVVEPLMPIFGSIRATEKPGASFSTMKAEIESPVRANDDVGVGDAGVGDEALGTVDHPLVAVAPRRGAHRPRVRPRSGLGQRVGADPLPARPPRQVSLPLLGRAGQLDRQSRPATAPPGSGRPSHRPRTAPRRRAGRSACRCRCRRTRARSRARTRRSRAAVRPPPRETRPACPPPPRGARSARGPASAPPRSSSSCSSLWPCRTLMPRSAPRLPW